MLSTLFGCLVVLAPTTILAIRHLPEKQSLVRTSDWIGLAFLAAYVIYVLSGGFGKPAFRLGTTILFKYLLPSLGFALAVFPQFAALESASPWRRDETTTALYRLAGYLVLFSAVGPLLATHG